MPMRVRGSVAAIVARLSVTGVAIANSARAQMRREAYNLRDIARLMVPRERMDMEKAINAVPSASGKGWVISPDPTAAADGTPGNVGAYLTFLHDGRYNLGPASVAKQAGNPYRVGPGFIERAYNEAVRSGMLKRVREAVRRAGGFDRG